MIDSGLVIADFMVRPTGVLVLFATASILRSTAFASETGSLATKALAQLAASGGLWSEERLFNFYRNLPETYKGKLPDVNRTRRATPAGPSLFWFLTFDAIFGCLRAKTALLLFGYAYFRCKSMASSRLM